MSHPAPPYTLPQLPEDALPPEALRAISALFGEGHVVVHRPCFARLFGGAACGILLSQFWFWTGTPTVRARTDGWFWKPQREITEETGLSRAETETARRRLCAQGILEERRRGIPAVMHFRVDMNVVMRRLWVHLQAREVASKCTEAPRTATRGTRTFVRGVVANKSAGIAQSTSERTSETTSEKTQEMTQTQTRARPAARPVLPSVFGERGASGAIRVTASAVGASAVGEAQQAVNLSGAARFKAALAAAPGRAPPARDRGKRAR